MIISTYNSGRFILETLESVSDQSWKNLEIVVTDDCSEDDTVEICRGWLNDRRSRFSGVKVLTHNHNTGISGNANRGLASAAGEWIKFLGADDTLKPACVEENMAWVSANSEIKVLFSQTDTYKDTFEPGNLISRTPEVPYDLEGLLAPWRKADDQYRMLLTSDRIHFSPSMFIHRQTLISAGGFDERFRMLEDYPLWLNLTKNGVKLYFMDKVTVNYRRHAKAINNKAVNQIVNENYFKQEDFRKEYTYPNLPLDIRFSQKFTWYASQVFRFKKFNKRTTLNLIIYNLLTVYLNPFKYLIWLKRRFVKDLSNNVFY